MSKAKRIISILLAMVLMITAGPVIPVEAAQDDETTRITVESVGAKPGSLVDVDVTIENNPGILGAVLKLTYDKALTLESVTEGEAFSELEMTKPGGFASTGCSFGWDGMEATDTDGVIMTLTFRVSETAVKNEKLNVSVSYKEGDIFDVNSKNIAVEVENGRVIVIDYVPGDLNTDDSVNMKDVVALRRYIVGDAVAINEPAADVNDDGTPNMKDVVQIRQFIVGGYGVVLMPSTKMCDHVMEQTVYKAPTCTEAGNVGYYYCALCERYFADAEGTTELAEEQLVLEALGHTVEIDAAVAPTENSTGLTEGSHCSVCNIVIVEQQEIPKLEAKTHSISYRNLQGAANPEPTSYKESEGLAELPVPVREGYTFKGWYTASEGGTVVDYIPAGSTQDYVLFARWDLEKYSIIYWEAPEHSNKTEYTVEDRVILEDPKWSGLKFVEWQDAKGNVYTEIPKGTTGDLELTAIWKLQRNIAIPSKDREIEFAYFDPETNQYCFAYEMGTIEHVVIDELNANMPNAKYHTGAGDLEFGLDQTVTVEESVADSIAETISKSVSSSKEWEKTIEDAKEKSWHVDASVTVGVEWGAGVKGKFEASLSAGGGGSNTHTEAKTEGGSYSEDSGVENEVATTVSYLESITSTITGSVTVERDMPEGYYSYVHAGNIRVFGLVTYNTETGNYHMNTYSILDNMHEMLLYYPDAESLNKPTCETLPYNVPMDKIFDMIENCYYVEYDANEGKGEMNRSVHNIGEQQTLLSNAFARTGYNFVGWTQKDENGETAYIYQDGQAVLNIAESREVVTLYADWDPIHYAIAYNANVPEGASTTVEYMPSSTSCEYDADVTLSAIVPTLTGYTFGGWYMDAACTEKVGDADQTITKPNYTTEDKGVINVYAKWTPNIYNLIYNFNGGTADVASKEITFDSMYGEFAVPAKSQHQFMGWTLNGQWLNPTDYVRIPEDHTADAQWLRIEDVVKFRCAGEGDLTITDNDGVYDEVSPGFDREALLAAGYNKMKIVLTFELYEQDQGYKDIWLWTDNKLTKLASKEDIEVPKREWVTRSYTFLIDISKLEPDCGFTIEWGANGNGGDDWYLSDTTITMTAEYVNEGA